MGALDCAKYKSFKHFRKLSLDIKAFGRVNFSITKVTRNDQKVAIIIALRCI